MLMVQKKGQDEGPGGPEGAGIAIGVAPAPAVERPDPEVPAKPRRRRFTAEYKQRIVREADRCAPGERGALLRREGLYFSLLTTWRRQRDSGELAGLKPKKRGRKAKPKDPRDKVIAENEREIRRLRRKLEQAETIIEVQKKVSTLLGIPLRSPDDEGND